MESIISIFTQLIESGKVKGTLGGPKQNVLICDTNQDYCIASTAMIEEGFSVLSPGAYSGSSEVSRKALDARVWRYGTVCAISYNKKTLMYHDKFLYIVSEMLWRDERPEQS